MIPYKKMKILGILVLGLVSISSHVSLATSSASLTVDQISECQEAFTLFDPTGSGTSIPTSQLGNAMRSLGQNVTNTELASIKKEFNLNENETISYQQFLNIMAGKM